MFATLWYKTAVVLVMGMGSNVSIDECEKFTNTMMSDIRSAYADKEKAEFLSAYDLAGWHTTCETIPLQIGETK